MPALKSLRHRWQICENQSSTLLVKLPPPPLQTPHWFMSSKAKDTPSERTQNCNLFKMSFRFIFIYECFVCRCICTTCIHGAWEGQKRVSDLLRLELQIVVSLMWVLGIKPGPLRKAVNVLNDRASSLALRTGQMVHRENLIQMETNITSGFLLGSTSSFTVWYSDPQLSPSTLEAKAERFWYLQTNHISKYSKTKITTSKLGGGGACL